MAIPRIRRTCFRRSTGRRQTIARWPLSRPSTPCCVPCCVPPPRARACRSQAPCCACALSLSPIPVTLRRNPGRTEPLQCFLRISISSYGNRRFARVKKRGATLEEASDLILSLLQGWPAFLADLKNVCVQPGSCARTAQVFF